MTDAPKIRPLADVTDVLMGRRVRLRPATLDDVPAFTALFSDPAVTKWWPAPDPAAEAAEHATPGGDGPDGVRWAIELPGAGGPGGPGLVSTDVIGLIQAYEETDPEFRSAGIDIALTAAIHGRGLGPDAIRAVARFLFARGHHRLTIDPAAANERAIRAYTAVGFRPVGTLRAYQLLPPDGWVDGLLMDMLAGELLEAAAEPGG